MGAGCSFQADVPLHSQPGGFIGGGQIGYNWQFDRLIAGLETDFQGTTASGSSRPAFINTLSGAAALEQIQVSSKTDYLGTVRGRLGVAVIDTAIVYATGGLAYGGGSVSSIFAAPLLAAPGALYPSSSSYTRAGWTIGGGAEYAFTPQLSLKAEALYYNLGTVKTGGGGLIGASGFTEGKSFELAGVIGRVGLNVKFDWLSPGVPVVAKY